MAVEVSTKQMALTRDTGPGGFMERVLAMLSFCCSTVLTEASSVPYHAARATYAQNVVRNPKMATDQAGPQVVMGVNVINTTTYDEVNRVSTCTITDLDLQSQILTLWNSLAGIDAA